MTLSNERLLESLRTIASRFEETAAKVKEANANDDPVGIDEAVDELADIATTLREAVQHVERAFRAGPQD